MSTISTQTSPAEQSAGKTQNKKRGKKGGWTKLLALGGAVAVLAGVGVFIAAGMTGSAAAGTQTPTFKVAQGPLLISVTESGTISSKNQVVVKSQVEGKHTILKMVPEGTYVHKGDLLVKLDSSDLESKLVDQQIDVQNAHAALIQAQEALAVAKNKARSDVSQAELDYRFAKEDLIKYQKGEFPQSLKEAQSKIELAQEKYKQAANTLDWSKKLYQDKYISKSELESDRLAKNSAELDLKLAKGELNLLVQYTKKRQIAQLTSDVKQKKSALERTQRSAHADVIKAQSDLRAKDAKNRREEARLAKNKEQIAKCRITAPTSGMVVYATTGHHRRNQEPLEEGQTVRQQQELVFLPPSSAQGSGKVADVKVHESSLDKIAVGQAVQVSIDAIPGKTFQGKVSKISPLPDAQSVWLNPDLKVYDTEVALKGPVEGVRTGMSCRARILVDQFQNATYLPVQSVVRIGDQPTVYVRNGPNFAARPVKIGLSNNAMVRVLGGVEPGQRVSMTPPLAQANAVRHKMAMGGGADAEEADGQAAPPEPSKAKSDGNAAHGAKQGHPRRHANNATQKEAKRSAGASTEAAAPEKEPGVKHGRAAAQTREGDA